MTEIKISSRIVLPDGEALRQCLALHWYDYHYDWCSAKLITGSLFLLSPPQLMTDKSCPYQTRRWGRILLRKLLQIATVLSAKAWVNNNFDPYFFFFCANMYVHQFGFKSDLACENLNFVFHSLVALNFCHLTRAHDGMTPSRLKFTLGEHRANNDLSGLILCHARFCDELWYVRCQSLAFLILTQP